MTTEVEVLLGWTVGQLPQIQLDGPPVPPGLLTEFNDDHSVDKENMIRFPNPLAFGSEIRKAD